MFQQDNVVYLEMSSESMGNVLDLSKPFEGGAAYVSIKIGQIWYYIEVYPSYYYTSAKKHDFGKGNGEGSVKTIKNPQGTFYVSNPNEEGVINVQLNFNLDGDIIAVQYSGEPVRLTYWLLHDSTPDIIIFTVWRD